MSDFDFTPLDPETTTEEARAVFYEHIGRTPSASKPAPSESIPEEDTLFFSRDDERDAEADMALEGVAKMYNFVTRRQLSNLPPMEWLVEDHLQAGAFNVLYGQPGSAKSFLALDWAARVATGLPWHGGAVRPGTVVYLAAEGVGGLDQRLTAWEDKNGIEVPEENFLIIRHPVRLLSEEEAATLIRTLESVPDLALVVVDTLARCIVGGDENSAKDMGEAVHALTEVTRRTGAAVLLLHHSGKDGVAARGSGALLGAADVQMKITKAEDSAARTLWCDKVKDAEAFKPKNFMLSSHLDSAVLVATSVGAPRVQSQYSASTSTFGSTPF